MGVRISPIIALTLLTACGGGPKPFTHTLASGIVVDVSAQGRLTLRDGERVVFDTAEGRAPRAHDFSLGTESVVGFYRFTRNDEVVSSFSRYRGARLEGDAVVATYGGDRGRLTLRIAQGPTAESTAITVEAPEGVDAVGMPIACDPEASFLGFGAQYEQTDQRGEIFDLWVEEQGIGRDGSLWFLAGGRHDTYFPMPYYLDARGFGLVVDVDARVLVDLCATDADTAWIEAEGPTSFTMLALHGPTPRDVVRELGDIFGRPETIPDWAFGPWMGIQGGQQAVLDEADALDAAMIPYTALWAQDWTGLRAFVANLIGVNYRWVPDTSHYPDLAGLTDTLHARGKRFLGYANPFVMMNLDHWADMSSMDLLIGAPGGGPYVFSTPAGEGSLPDLTNPLARAYVTSAFTDMVDVYGMDGWMCDFGEWLPTDAVLSDASSPVAGHQTYPNAWHDLCRTVADERTGGDYATFSRSGWLGAQGTTQIAWIGDQEADDSLTDGLPTVVPALLSLGLSGVPFVTHDIAGFSGGPRTKTLFMRWTELGAFTTVMRTHEGLMRATNWDWHDDAETEAHFRRFARIHEALVPLLHDLAIEASQTSMPPMRHLALVFPDDVSVRGTSDAFMLGDALLVAPITREDETSRSVYLPAGTWYHVWTGEMHVGPITLEVLAPMGSPPVFSLGVDRPDLRAIDGL